MKLVLEVAFAQDVIRQVAREFLRTGGADVLLKCIAHGIEDRANETPLENERIVLSDMAASLRRKAFAYRMWEEKEYASDNTSECEVGS